MADENRARYGRSLAERQAEASQAARLKSGLDGHKLEEPRPRRPDPIDE